MMPFANIRLIAVASPGDSEDFAHTTTPGAAKWTGDVGAYLRDATRVTVGDSLDVIVATTLTVPLTVRVEFAPNDLLTYVRRGAQTSRRVRDVQAFEATGTVRLILFDA